jgi:hypothetical protein
VTPGESKPDPAAIFSQLRENFFTIAPAKIGLAPGTGHRGVWAVVMETGYDKAVVSLIAIADGTTSLYFSSGGGIIGAGEHKAVHDAAVRLVALADEQADQLALADAHPLPGVGRVRIYARTFNGLLTLEADEQDLGLGRHPLSQLFHAGHAVIAAVREFKEQHK